MKLEVFLPRCVEWFVSFSNTLRMRNFLPCDAMTNVEQSISKEHPLEEPDRNDKVEVEESKKREKDLATAALMLKPIRLLCRSQLD